MNSLVACGSDDDAGSSTTPDGGGDGRVANPPGTTDEAGILDAGGDSACQDHDPDADIECTGKCGPVHDFCTGKVKECGGCANAVTEDGGDGGAQACDLTTNTCGKPKITCTELGAECGTVKNSCGAYIDCPACGDGKECDPDTHKCRECSGATCKDLGFECGLANLGCGTAETDCGQCADLADGGKQTCNTAFHKCEPTCTPKTKLELCNAAKAARGDECGVISNGCGGTVLCDSTVSKDFGCKAGEACGVRGITNRCDPVPPSDECVAQGKNCGTVKSVCDGTTIKCGDCAAGKVCNTNGVCGDPCTPKTCDDFKTFECGRFDDGCGSKVTCGTCANGVCNEDTNTCCGTNTCTGTYAGKCGQDLDNGCGSNSLDCNCTAANTTCTLDGGATPAPPTSSTGMCCVQKTAATYTNAGQCGTKLPTGCGQNNINAPCPGTQVCVNNGTGSPGAAPPDGTPGTCCTRTDTCTGQAANSCQSVQNSCRPGSTVACNTNCTSGTTCNAGTCCHGAAACVKGPGNGDEGAECNVTHDPVDTGCGSARQCNCAGGRTCLCGDHPCAPAEGAGVCKTALTCSSPAYAGKCGTNLPNGVGGVIPKCGCGNEQVCTTSVDGAVGTCQCDNPTHLPYTCANVPGGPGQPGGDACGDYTNGCGSPLSCKCGPGLTCNKSPNPNVCCTGAVCPTPAEGSACGAVSNGCSTVQCGCPSGTGFENFSCGGDNKCHCVKDTCRGRVGIFSDRCGGVLTDCKG